MDYHQILTAAREKMTGCKACPVCNGKACGSNMPGPGAKGGTGAIRNFEKWQNVFLEMDTLCENRPIDTSLELFGRKFAYPIFAAPIGALRQHYNGEYNDMTYNDVLIPACAQAGIAAFTGDGMKTVVMERATAAMEKCGGTGIPTIKPWDTENVKLRMDMGKAAGVPALAMDIDAAGLPFLKDMGVTAGRKGVDELRRLAEYAQVPFILKGIMNAKAAKKALEAGAAGIVVSNHGGRVLDSCPATAEVLEEIADAVGGRMTILVDGGIRSGTDVFKALALGADAVLIGRPFVVAVYGDGAEGVQTYVDKLGAELRDAMFMCGASKLSKISRDMVRIIR